MVVEEKTVWQIKNFPSEIRRKIVGDAISQNRTVSNIVEEIMKDYLSADKKCNCHAKK